MTHTGLRNVLFFICLALAAGLLLRMQTGLDPVLVSTDEPKIQVAEKPPQEPNALDNTMSNTPVSIKNYQELEKRPLFVSGRRPPDPDLVKVMDLPKTRKVMPKALSLVLMGILQDGETLRAYIKGDRATPPLALGEGEQIDGWTVKEIAKAQVTLARNGKQQQLQLDWKGSGTIRRTPPRKRRAVQSADRPQLKQNKASPVNKKML